MRIEYDNNKNNFLKRERKITFEDIISKIQEGSFLIIDHPNKNQYPSQIIILVLINDYVYAVPSKIHGSTAILVTVYKSRKFNKLFKNKLRETVHEKIF